MRHIPPGYVGLLDKVDEIGRAKYGDGWRGDKVAELRKAVPPEISRTPPPIEPLGVSSVGTPAGKINRGRPLPSAEQLARYAQERQAARQHVAEAESQRENVIDDLQKCLWLSEQIAYEQLADGGVVSLPRNWAYSDHAAVAFFTGKANSGRAVLISKWPDSQEEPAEEPSPSPAQPTESGDTEAGDGDTAPTRRASDEAGLGVTRTLRRRNKNEMRSVFAKALRDMGWVNKEGRVVQPSGSWKVLCQKVEAHLGRSIGECKGADAAEDN
jgi:hypothetical protein